MRPSSLATHACAALQFAFIARAAAVGRGWTTVARVDEVPDAPTVSIVVPARNEAATIERCVRSLLGQRGLDAFEIVVVEDRSDDATPEVLRRLEAEDPRLRVVRGAPLPDGWVGKPWACAQGAAVAAGEWLLFTDADSVHAPAATVSALAHVLASDADALTVLTGQDMHTWAERAILPTILGMIVLVSGTVAQLNDPASPEHALANGQYLLVRRDAYDALGGHVALRDEIVEDVAFAKRLKRDGRYRLRLAGMTDLVRVRMYDSFGALRAGFTKNLYAGAALNGGAAGLAAGIASFLALSAIPTALGVWHAVHGRRGLALESAACVLGTIAVTADGLRRYRVADPKLAVWAPVGLTVFAAITAEAWFRVASGRGVAWRGRRYSGRAGSSSA